MLVAALACCVTSGKLRSQDAITESEPVVVTGTRTDVPLDESPATTSVVTAEDFEQKQIERVADALREVPGLSVVQTGAPGQLTSVFTRGLRSEHTQVLLDGIPINQGLAGLMNFADFTTDDVDHIEVARGPQSTLYGPRALAGAIQIFTKRGNGEPSASWGIDGGSFDTAHEFLEASGQLRDVDYSLGASRFDSDFERQNSTYRLTNSIGNIGWSPNEQLRIASLFTYSFADAGSPNSIFDPRPFDRLKTERWLIGPHIDFTPVEWWSHKLIFDYDHELQINNPNEDGFTGATRAVFERTQIDYQNDIRATSWLTMTSGFFYSRVNAGQERPFVSQAFGPQPTFVSDHTVETAGFAQASITPFDGLNLVAGGRIDHFNQFGDVWTWRVAGSYTYRPSGTTIHSSVATGFSPPSSQDKIFGNNFGLEPERDLGWDAGLTQRLWNNRVTLGATYFHNHLSNLIGFNGQFETLNLGSARTQGVELELKARPVADLTIAASYTYLDAVNTSSTDVTQLPGARLPRRPRNEAYVSASYLWCKRLRFTAEAKFVNAREELNFGGPNFDIEDYAFVNIAAEFDVNPHLTIFARIDNLTDEQYAEVFGFPALGRAVYGGWKVRF
jgi:vitamin B12 transporter